VNIIGVIAQIFGLSGIAYLLFILAELSKRLGLVTKMAPYYRGLYFGAGCVIFALAAWLLARAESASPELELAFLRTPLADELLYQLPLAVGMTVSLVVAWRYWGWLLRER
jgi:hypothetical protein